jgi:predicted nucleic acid-binding protein
MSGGSPIYGSTPFLNLDFDDAYQFSVAQENNLAIATQDKDFQRVRNVVSVRLL